jgi:hypothetical protein
MAGEQQGERDTGDATAHDQYVRADVALQERKT